MVARRFTVCDQQQLRNLLSESLRGDQQLQMVKHLDGCPKCQKQLESMAGNASWWTEAREYLTPAPDASDENSDDDYNARTEIFPWDSTADTPTDAPSGHNLKTTLSFLEPSTEGNLGKLGRYEISDLVGRGGMGIVLEAFDPTLQRKVAVKVLAPWLADSAAARRRFEREARAAAAVAHVHVVPIHEVNEAAGLPYLVMPLVTGGSLQKRLDDQGPLPLVEVLRIGMQAAAGLAAAHAQGLVHRDIKPANILLENGVNRVLLADFGLARAVDDATLTRSGLITGTPCYMSPEQAQGESLDHRADLFSLGSVIYTMCTGHPPFRAETMVAVLRRICDDQPRSLREVNEEIPAWLDAIVLKLLAKKPEDRWQTAEEVSGVLESCLAHVQQPTNVPLPDEVVALARLESRRQHPLFTRRRLAVAASVMAPLVLLGGLELADVTHFSGSPVEESVNRLLVDPEPIAELAEPPVLIEAIAAAPHESAAIVYPPGTQWDDPVVEELQNLGEQIDASLGEGIVTESALPPTVTSASDPLGELRGQIDQLEEQVEENIDVDQ
jgi:serine/threonine protein kinase